MEFTKLAKMYQRMCESYPNLNCSKCPLHMNNNGHKTPCQCFVLEHPEESEKIILKWDEEHPTKTRLQDIIEKYPGLVTIQMGRPHVCAVTAGYIKECPGGISCSECWIQPI